MLIQVCQNLFFKKGRGGKKEEEEKYEGFPRPGGDFVAPGKKVTRKGNGVKNRYTYT
jgi:hypothetical protein